MPLEERPVNTNHPATDGSMKRLRDFRRELYSCFERRADAIFKLTDAILTAGTVPSPPHLSLAPIHRRGWGSLYGALSRGEIDAERLRELLASYDPGTNSTPIYAVDVSPWPRCDAESSPGRSSGPGSWLSRARNRT